MTAKETREPTPKQARFVSEYLIDLNATQAAVRAGYSKKTADRIGPELLGKTCVSAAIKAAQKKRAAKSERTALDVLRDIQAVTREARGAGSHGVALKGLELEGKHLGMFTDKVDLRSSDGSMSPIPSGNPYEGMTPEQRIEFNRVTFGFGMAIKTASAAGKGNDPA